MTRHDEAQMFFAAMREVVTEIRRRGICIFEDDIMGISVDGGTAYYPKGTQYKRPAVGLLVIDGTPVPPNWVRRLPAFTGHSMYLYWDDTNVLERYGVTTGVRQKQES